MDFKTCFQTSPALLMEGALGERLKREYHILPDVTVALAGLVYDDQSRQALLHLYKQYISIAAKYHLPFIATTPTRRANRERVLQSRFTPQIIADNVRFLRRIQASANTTMFIGGMMGCKGDAYRATEVLPLEEAHQFHAWQANLFKESGVDFLFAAIMPALSEAVGMAQAMADTGLPFIISFMIRNNGRLIDGATIHDAISTIDRLATPKPLCYMTNCVHPKVLSQALACPFNQTNAVLERFRGIQANASPLSPAELDHSPDLQSSDSVALATDMMALIQYFTPKIFGGCCGTDHTHLEEIAKRISK